MSQSTFFFSHVGTEPTLPGFNQLVRSECVLLKDTTRWRLWGSNPGPLDSESDGYHYTAALPKNNFVPVLYQLHVRIYSRHVILRLTEPLQHGVIYGTCVRACVRACVCVCVCSRKEYCHPVLELSKVRGTI